MPPSSNRVLNLPGLGLSQTEDTTGSHMTAWRSAVPHSFPTPVKALFGPQEAGVILSSQLQAGLSL